MTSSNEKPDIALLSWINQVAPYGVITLDESLQVKSWNHWMELHSGMRSQDVLGKKLFSLYPDLAGRRLGPIFERALQGEPIVLSTGLHRYLLPFRSSWREHGDEWMRQTARIAPLRSEGTVSGVVVLIEDVTQRESQAETLHRQHRRDETLSWALAHFLKAEEPRKTIRQLFFRIAEHLDFDTFLVFFRNPETGGFGLFASGGIPPDAEKEFGNSPLLLSVADGREPVVFNSVRSRSEPEYAILNNAGISAAVAIPLVAKDRSLGMICFATCTRESIAQEESDLLATIAQYLALAVDRENTQNALQIAQAELSQHALILEKRVEDRTSQLKETISELETFSYTLAHDLKAPVRAMRGYCQILLEDFAGVLPARADLIIQKLARAPKRMEALIHDLLEFNEVSRQNIVFCRVDLEAILNDVLSLRTSDVLQAVTIARPLHPVRAHKALLQQVLSNLVDNAVKFVKPMTPPKISIRTEVVARSSPSTREAPLIFSATEPVRATGQTLALETIEGPVRIWVIDEGIGISPEVHQKIFGIFERGMGTEIYEGTGIGLAIVARAMQRMGGTFGVESALGTGSRFWLELPGAATEVE